VDVNQLLNKIATPGDVAAAGIGFVLGLPLDYFFLHLAVPPGVVSGYSALGLFSLKKAAEALYEGAKKRRDAYEVQVVEERDTEKLREQKQKELEALRNGFTMRVYSLKRFFEDEKLPQNLELVVKLDKMHTADILSDLEFDESLRRVIADYRNRRFALTAKEFPTRLELPPANVEDEETDLVRTESEDD
jgi:hypothetical protein